MWLAVHLVYITGFKNRVTAVLHWFVSFLGRGRSERTATEQQIFGRTALARLGRGATDLVSAPGELDHADAERDRREELEAQAAEEVRLTDESQRGDQGLLRQDLSRTSLGRRGSGEERSATLARRPLAGDPRGPPRQDEDALGLDGDAVGADDVALRPGLDALGAVDPGLGAQVAERACPGGSAA